MNFKDEKAQLLEEAIVRTIAFFDLFDYPLTDFEVWKFLSEKCDYTKVRNILNLMSLRGVPPLASGGTTKQSQQGALTEIASPRGGARNDSNVIETKNSFYFLKSRESIIRTRLERYNFTDRKFKRALRVAKIYRSLPWVKMIAVANIIGAHNLKDKSDIDFFIIAEKNKIWLTRFFCVGVAKVLGLRPSEKNSRDKICLNFYVSEEDMNLKKFTLEENDIYFIYWLANLIPIYKKDDMYTKFIQANGWLKSYLPNWQPVLASNRRIAKSGENKVYEAIINLIFGHLEKILKNIQLKLMPKEITELANKDSRVVINDNILKLHIKDRRREYRDEWMKKIKNFYI